MRPSLALIAAGARIIASARRPSASTSSSAIDPLLDAKADDAHHLRQSRHPLLVHATADALLEGGKDGSLAGTLDGEDEREAEAGDISGVELMKLGELFRG